MLHITYGSAGTFRVTTEEKRCNTSVASSQIRLLFKFTNDMDKRVVYAYGQNQVHNDAIRTYQRYTKVVINHNATEDVFAGRVNFRPMGYWKYEIYEVSWIGTVRLAAPNAPVNETTVLEVDDDNGIVQCLVETGKLYVTETVGDEQVRYTTYTETAGTNYIHTEH